MKPAVIIVHGAWHSPEHYEPLRAAIQATGLFHPVVCPRLPTSVPALPMPATADLPHDTDTIHQALRALADAGHPILVLMHSYGGVVGNNALQGLLWPQRRASGRPGGVVHLIYLAALVIPSGNPLDVFFNPQAAPWLEFDEVAGLLQIQDPRTTFFNDVVDDAVAEKWLARCTLFPTRACHDVQTSDPFEFVGRGVGATYVVALKDYRLTPEMQEGMASLLGEARKLWRCDAGHNLIITAVDEVVRVVRAAWESRGDDDDGEGGAGF
jgi:pimeloyl-ACP methyl ester carboxylesterase